MWYFVSEDDDDSEPTAAEPEGGASLSVASEDLTAADLEPLLITEAQTGGFVENYRGEIDESRQSIVENMPAECQSDLDDLPNPSGDPVGVTAEFTHEREQLVHQLRPRREGARSFSELAASLTENCAGPFTVADEAGNEFEVSIAAEHQPLGGEMGEDSASVLMSLDHAQLTGSLEFYLVASTRNGIVSTVLVTGGLDVEQSTPGNDVTTPANQGLVQGLVEEVDSAISEQMG